MSDLPELMTTALFAELTDSPATDHAVVIEPDRREQLSAPMAVTITVLVVLLIAMLVLYLATS